MFIIVIILRDCQHLSANSNSSSNSFFRPTGYGQKRVAFEDQFMRSTNRLSIELRSNYNS